MAPSAAPASTAATTPSTWSIIAVVFITLFTLVVVASGLTIAYLNHRKKELTIELANITHSQPTTRNHQGQQRLNPHSFGTRAWQDWEYAQAPRAEHDALRLASLQQEISMHEDAAESQEQYIQALVSQNRALLRGRHQERQFAGVQEGDEDESGALSTDGGRTTSPARLNDGESDGNVVHRPGPGRTAVFKHCWLDEPQVVEIVDPDVFTIGSDDESEHGVETV